MNDLAAEGEPLRLKCVRSLVQEDVTGLREDGPAFRLPADVLRKLFLCRVGLAGIHRIVIISAPVHHNSVQPLVGRYFLEQFQKEGLNLLVRRVQETATDGS